MRKLSLLGAALAAALAAGALAVTLGFGSSHREAPLSSLDPTGDDTDLYAFTAPDAPGSLTLVANRHRRLEAQRRADLLGHPRALPERA